LFLAILVLDQSTKLYVKTHFYIGEEVMVIPNWFRIAFTENPGAAFGMELGGNIGKYILSIFRILFSFFIVYILVRSIRERVHKGFTIAIALVLAGAIGNVIDGMFYGLFFSESIPFHMSTGHLVPFGHGYAGFLQGKVVDMLYFPIFNGFLPEWIPMCGGQPFTFFSPIFNIADSSITIGVVLLMLFMNKVDFSKK
jgi:signal peptidase II